MQKIFESVSIRKELVNKIKEYIQKSENYRSIAEFVSEAVRLRLEQLDVKVSEGSGVAPHVLTMENEKLQKEKESAVQ